MKMDKHTTLFLDRDGVINVRLVGDYVKRVEEFVFLPGVPEAIAELQQYFARIVVVTNQQGISKGLYSIDDLAAIHAYMREGIARVGGKIDAVYFAPNASAEHSPLRKPGIGMALQAQQDFPEIDFSNSIMVGDSNSDMAFARNAGMWAVFVGEASQPEADWYVEDLKGFLMVVKNSLPRMHE